MAAVLDKQMVFFLQVDTVMYFTVVLVVLDEISVVLVPPTPRTISGGINKRKQCDWPCKFDLSKSKPLIYFNSLIGRIQCTGSVYGTSTSSQQVRTEKCAIIQ